MFPWLCIVFMFFQLSVSAVYAQRLVSFVPIRTQVSNDDSVRSRVAILDNSFQHVKTGIPLLGVRDNGTTPVVNQATDATAKERELSLLFAVDLSTSMGIASARTSGVAPIAIAEAAITNARNLMVRSFDELGLVGIGARSELLFALSSDKQSFGRSITSLRPLGGYNLQRGLFDVPTGALSHLQSARNARALVLLTDGNAQFDAISALAVARTYNIHVYVVGIGTKLSNELRQLADSSGGAYVENIVKAADAALWTCGFVVHAKQLEMVTLSWPLPESCDSSRTVEISDRRNVQSASYTLPSRRIKSLESVSDGIDFGLVKLADTATTTVTIQAPNAPVTVSSLQVTANAGFEIVNPPSLPFVVTSARPLSVSVRYIPTTTDAVYSTLTFTSDACVTDSVILRAGTLFSGQTVQLVGPNGGERFVAGRDTVVRWTNALPSDFMRLEVSTNAGTSWSTVTESASGMSYKWSPGPGVAEQCLMRITGTVIDQRSILRLRGQTQPVYCSVFTPDSRLVITGGDDGTVRTWDATTGEQARVIGIHGNWVWALATMPGTTLVASASHDGTVRVWDYRTSARIATVNLGSRVWSVAFSKDGKVMFAGTERAIVKITTDTWSIEQLLTVTEGPVHDVHISADASFLVSAEGPTVFMRSTADLTPIREYRDQGQNGNVYAVSMPSTDDVIVTGGADFILRKYKVSDGTLLTRATPAVGSILGLSYNSDDSKLLSAGGDATAKIHNPDDLTVQVSLAGHNGIVYGASFSSNDSLVVTASTDLTARVWPLSKLGTVSDLSDAPFSIEGGEPQRSDVSFGDVYLGSGRDTSSVVLRNESPKPVIVRSVRLIDGKQATDFDLNVPPVPFVVLNGTPLPLDVQFVPSDVGTRTATVEIHTGVGIQRITLSGNGVRPALQVREVLDFGRHVANQEVVDSSITIQALGDPSASYDVTLSTIIGEQSSVFSILSGGAPFTIRGGESRKLNVRFDPKTFGAFASDLVLRINGFPAQVVRLYGEATGEGRIASGSTLLFASNTCVATPSQRTFSLRNSGNAQTIIYSIGLEGADADEFSVSTAGTYPITIDAKDSLPITVSFVPKRVGVKDIRVVISSNASNALNGRTVINMSARRDSVGFELSRSTIAFSNVAEGEILSDRLQIINTGTITLRWPRSAINLGPFRIDSIVPDITPGGRTSALIVTFLGGQAGRSYDTSYTFIDTICGRQQTLRLSASVKSVIGATVKIGSVGANTGQLVTVPVYVTGKINLDRTPVREVVAHLSVNGTVLTPAGGTPAGSLQTGGIRRFSVPIPLRSNDSLATTLTFQTTWGNDTSSFIRIDSITANDTLTFRTINGQVILQDICRVGGRPRLVTITNNGAGIVVHPSPAGNHAVMTMDVVERGYTEVRLYDAGSRLIAVPHNGWTSEGRWVIPLDLSSLQSGVYFLVMTTPSESFTQRMEVIR